MIVTRNGYGISNVVVSTVLGIDGNGILPLEIISPAYRKCIRIVRKSGTTVLGKSFTHQKRIGNFIFCKPWTRKYIQTLEEDGMLNAYGLTNGGAEREIPKIIGSLAKGNKIIPNVYLDFSEGSEGMEDAFQQAKKVLVDMHTNVFVYGYYATEFNFSCPNDKKDIVKNVQGAIYICRKIRKLFPGLTTIAKISYVHPYELAEELEKAGVDIIHAINTIPWKIVYPDKISPLADVGGGGVSGGPAKDLSLKYNRELRKRIKIPIIMGCGVTSLDDVERFEGIGANSVSMCTIVRRNPEEAIKIIRIKNMGGER